MTGEYPQINKIVGSAAGYIIVEGQNASAQTGLYAYNITGESFSTLMTPGDYAISAFDVDATGNVTVSATRASDGAIILANFP